MSLKYLITNTVYLRYNKTKEVLRVKKMIIGIVAVSTILAGWTVSKYEEEILVKDVPKKETAVEEKEVVQVQEEETKKEKEEVEEEEPDPEPKPEEVKDPKPEPELEPEPEPVKEEPLVETASTQPKGERIVMNVTGYTAGYESTGKHPGHPEYGLTASGAYVEKGVTIAAGKNIPFGTKIYIPYFEGKPGFGDGIFTVQDRGSAIGPYDIDVYFDNVDKAREFGRQNLEVYILN